LVARSKDIGRTVPVAQLWSPGGEISGVGGARVSGSFTALTRTRAAELEYLRAVTVIAD